MTALTFDQAVRLRLAAAEQQTLVTQLAAAAPDRTAQGTPNAWYRNLALHAVLGLFDGSSRPCPHLGRARDRAGFGPMYCVYRPQPTCGGPEHAPSEPMEIQCRDCFMADPPHLSPAEELSCDRCRIYARGLVSGLLPVGPLALIFGVCAGCAGELGVSMPTEGAKP